jgi:hypothetical protein
MKKNILFNSLFGKKSDLSEFRILIDNLHDYLGLTENQKNGLAFWVGMTLPISVFKSKIYDVESLKKDNTDTTNFILSLLKLYSNAPFNWENYKTKLDINLIRSKIYNFNFIYWNCLKQSDQNIDDFLKTIPELDLVIGKTSLENQWIERFFEASFNLKNVNKLYYDFIFSIGTHIKEVDLSFEESLGSGFAFYNHIVQQDIKGSHFLLSSISDSGSPLLLALQEYPILFKYNREALEANHIFSSIFQFLTMGIDHEILGPIHTFHQHLFYENGSTKFRDAWDFSQIDKNLLLAQTVQNSLAIRKTNLFEKRSYYLNSKEIFGLNLIKKKMSQSYFLNEIQSIIIEKYGYNLDLQEINSIGEFMELIAIVYYETCLHAMVVDEIIE